MSLGVQELECPCCGNVAFEAVLSCVVHQVAWPCGPDPDNGCEPAYLFWEDQERLCPCTSVGISYQGEEMYAIDYAVLGDPPCPCGVS